MDALKLKSSSHLFKKWVMQMDEILSKTHTHDQLVQAQVMTQNTSKNKEKG